MKSVSNFLFFVLYFSSYANAADVILQYNFGNQIYGSALTVYSDGTVTHSERSCCPPHSDTVGPSSFSGVELQDLQTHIEAAKSGIIQHSSSHGTSMGSQSGSLIVFSNGLPVVIHEVERGTIGRSDGLVSINLSADARAIEALVIAIVRHAPN